MVLRALQNTRIVGGKGGKGYAIKGRFFYKYYLLLCVHYTDLVLPALSIFFKKSVSELLLRAHWAENFQNLNLR